jgi:hypothetical protein
MLAVCECRRRVSSANGRVGELREWLRRVNDSPTETLGDTTRKSPHPNDLLQPFKPYR